MVEQCKYAIREYNSADFEACSEIFRSNVPKFFLDNELAEFQDFLRKYVSDGYWVIVDESLKNVYACGGIRVRVSGAGGLCYGMVASSLHKKRLGSALVRFRLAKLIAQAEVNCVLLDTSQHNPGFFQQFGFSVTGTEDNFYGRGLHRYDMRLDFPAAPQQRQLLATDFLRSIEGFDLLS